MPESSPLRIGVDARELVSAPTGVGRYLGELLRRWAQRPDAPCRRFFLYVPARSRGEAEAFSRDPIASACEIREVQGSGGTWWEQIQLPSAAARDRLAVFFAPAYTAPLRLRVPTVVAIHDVSYMAHPEWFPWRTGLRRRWLTRWSAARSVAVLTCSGFSRQEIALHTGLPPGRIEVTRYGFAATTVSSPGPESLREPLVLYAGSIFNRRHVPDLIRAFAKLAGGHPAARLVVAGENRTYPREDPAGLAASLGLGDRVEFRAYVSDRELGELYARARVFAFLSEYEGFGMTPLEALSAGVPILVYDTPVAREIYGAAAAFAPIGDVEAVAVALERLIADERERARILDRAPAVLARYSWDETAEVTLAAIERAARETGHKERGTGNEERAPSTPSRARSTQHSAPSTGNPVLSIVIVSYNARADLERCLRSLADAPPETPHEIVVVDNASPDLSAEAVRDRWPAVRLIALDRNRGFAAACNAGIRAGGAELVLLLNSDTIVPPGALDRLVARLRAEPAAAVAGPRLVDEVGRPELSFGSMIGPFAELRQKTLTRLAARRTAPIVRYVERATSREGFPDWVSGACLLVRRADAEAVGLLDERFFLYTEDVDFCAALRARGRRILFTPVAQVVHLRGRSRQAAPGASETAYRLSQLAFYAKHHPRWAPWLRLYLRVRGRLPR